jgi:hypothetical protein
LPLFFIPSKQVQKSGRAYVPLKIVIRGPNFDTVRFYPPNVGFDLGFQLIRCTTNFQHEKNKLQLERIDEEMQYYDAAWNAPLIVDS